MVLNTITLTPGRTALNFFKHFFNKILHYLYIDIFQLLQCMEEDLIFVDFEEGKLTFPPTYKFDPGTDNYDTR